MGCGATLRSRCGFSYDLEYIEQWSIWLDLKIIGLTMGRVLFDRNAY